MNTDEEKKDLLIDMLKGKGNYFDMQYIKLPGKDWVLVSNEVSKNAGANSPETLPNSK
jgi:hypothetical protein